MNLINYLDPVDATKKILRSWHDRDFAIQTIPDRVREINARLTRITTAPDTAPIKNSRQFREDLLINSISAKDRLISEYTETQETQARVEQCFNHLTEEERFLLREMYIDNEDRQGVERIQERLYIQKSEAYKRTDRALKRLAALLYWQ